MAKKEISNWFNDYIVSINYGTINPMSWGIWEFNENKYERLYSYYYDSRKEGIQKTDKTYIFEIFQKLIVLPRFSFKHSTVTFIIEPSAAGFIEELKRLATARYGATINIVHYKQPVLNLDIPEIKSDILYDINLCLSNNSIKLPFNVYKTIEDYPDRMLQEISMFLYTPFSDLSPSKELNNKKYKKGDCDMTFYFITVRDVTDAIFYVKAEDEKRAIIKLAQYFGNTIKLIDSIIDKINLEDVINLFAHYNLDICTVLQVEYAAKLIGSITDDPVITLIE